MERISRRAALAALAASSEALLSAGRAQATLMRGLSLQNLVWRSNHVLLVTGLDSQCHYLQIAGRRSIITETRVQIGDVVARLSPRSSELVVRTLGGRIDGEGELVHGQAEFSANSPCLAFLTRGADDSLWVTGMAQGHFPIHEQAGSEARLSISPHLPTIRDWDASGVRTLAGRTVSDARRLITSSKQP